MLRKATFILGFGTGYVLGTKAGRTRYEQIMRQARGLMGKPAMQDATSMIKDQAGSVIGSAKKIVTQKTGLGGAEKTDATWSTDATAYAGTASTSAGRVDPYPV